MAECRDSTINNTNTQKQSVVIGHNDSTEENKTDKVMGPALLEELKGNYFPQSFQKLQTSLEAKGFELDRNDYVVLFSHILMLESGFVVQDNKKYEKGVRSGFNYNRLLESVCKIPSDWKRNSELYVIRYVYPPFSSCCKVIFTLTDEEFIVNAFTEDIAGYSYSILIDPAKYVVTSTSNLCNKFQEIGHLSCLFKSDISNPLRNVILEFNNCQRYNINDMPYDILVHIMDYVDLKTSLNLRSTCKQLKLLYEPDAFFEKYRYKYTKDSWFGCSCNENFVPFRLDPTEELDP